MEGRVCWGCPASWQASCCNVVQRKLDRNAKSNRASAGVRLAQQTHVEGLFKVGFTTRVCLPHIPSPPRCGSAKNQPWNHEGKPLSQPPLAVKQAIKFNDEVDRTKATPINASLPILDQYILRELTQPLVYGLLAFSSLAISIGTSSEISKVLSRNSGLAGAQAAAALIVLRSPHFLALALPMASLLAPLLAFGKLGSSSETVALRANGVETERMVIPVALLFLSVTVCNLLLSEGLVPFANRRSTRLLETPSDIRVVPCKAPTPRFCASRYPIVYPAFHEAGGLACLFFARSFDGVRMLDVTQITFQSPHIEETSRTHSSQTSYLLPAAPNPINSRTGPGLYGISAIQKVSKAISAKAAHWRGEGRGWSFCEGAEYVYTGLEAPEPSTINLMAGPLTERPLLRELHTFHERVVSRLPRAPIDLAQAAGRNFDDMSLVEVVSLQKLLESSRNVKESRKMKLKIHQRLALPFACFVFGVLGSLISLRLSSDQKRLGFALTLVIVFTYYAVSVTGAVLAQLTIVPPVIGAWLPNMFGAIVAYLLLLERR